MLKYKGPDVKIKAYKDAWCNFSPYTKIVSDLTSLFPVY